MQDFDETGSEVARTVAGRRSRRSVMKGAAIGVAGVAGVSAVGAGVFASLPKQRAHAAAATSTSCTDTVAAILGIAATAEQLAVTFYANGIANAAELGISGQNLEYLKGAIIEEQLHLNLLVAAGGKPLTGTFSFPDGEDTFDNQDKFIATLGQLEAAFESAYIAAVKEFADMSQSGLAQLAAQIATVEAEHRALGRSISAKIVLANNWAFTPVLVKSVGDAVNVLSGAGYLSPVSGNSFTYQAASTASPYVVYRKPVVTPCS